MPILKEPSEHAEQCVEEELEPPPLPRPGPGPGLAPPERLPRKSTVESLVRTTKIMMAQIRAAEAAKLAVRNRALLARRARRDPALLIRTSMRQLAMDTESTADAAAGAAHTLALRLQAQRANSSGASALLGSGDGGGSGGSSAPAAARGAGRGAGDKGRSAYRGVTRNAAEQVSFFYLPLHFLRRAFSQFDSLPLTYLVDLARIRCSGTPTCGRAARSPSWAPSTPR